MNHFSVSLRKDKKKRGGNSILKKSRLTITYSLLQAVYWSLAVVMSAFMTPLLASQGFSSVQLGIIIAVKYGATIVFQVLIGALADAYINKISLKSMIAIIVLLGMAITAVYYVLPVSFLEVCLLFLLLGATVNCISPLIDALSIHYMNNGRTINYSVSRACGSLSYAISSVMIGRATDVFGIRSVLIIQLILLAAILLVLWILDEARVSDSLEKQVDKAHSTWYLIVRCKKFRIFLIAIFLVFLGANLSETFMYELFLRMGGDYTDFGIADAVLALSEVPTALFFVKLQRKKTTDCLMICCAIFMTFKALGMLLASSIPVLILVQAFEMLGNGLFYPAAVYIVMENVPQLDVVKGVSLINMATIGAGRAVGSLLSGVIKQLFGLTTLLVVGVIVSMVSILAMWHMKAAPKGLPL